MAGGTIPMRGFTQEHDIEAGERLEMLRRLIAITTCEALLPGLELYALQLERTASIAAVGPSDAIGGTE